MKNQKAIDDQLCKSGEASDGYHTFNELYDIRREYNAALVNSGVCKDKITVIYDTMHHSTEKLAFQIAEGIMSEGMEEMPNAGDPFQVTESEKDGIF